MIAMMGFPIEEGLPFGGGLFICFFKEEYGHQA